MPNRTDPTPPPNPYRDKLAGLGTALATVCTRTYHYFHPAKVAAPFIVWMEDGDNGLEADDGKAEQAISGTVDLFTKTEYDPALDGIQTALDGYGAAWYLNSVQYEDETGLIHYEWVFEVV